MITVTSYLMLSRQFGVLTLVRLRYRLSWLLLVPVVLAGVIWWHKPPARVSYDYLAIKEPGLFQAYGFYRVRQEYVDRQLLLDEIQDCDYAIVYLGADYSPTSKIMIKQLCEVSKHLQGRVPMFIVGFVGEEVFDWFPGKINYKYFDSCICIVQHGVITHQYRDYQTTDDIHTILHRILPWNYRL